MKAKKRLRALEEKVAGLEAELSGLRWSRQVTVDLTRQIVGSPSPYDEIVNPPAPGRPAVVCQAGGGA